MKHYFAYLWGDYQEEDEEEDNGPKPSWWGSHQHWQYRQWGADAEEAEMPAKQKQPRNFAKYRRTIKRATERECAYYEAQRVAKTAERHEAEKKKMREQFEKELQDAKNESKRLNSALGEGRQVTLNKVRKIMAFWAVLKDLWLLFCLPLESR